MKVAQTDPRLLTGVIFGRLGAKPDAIAAYRELEPQEAFQHPLPYDAIETGRYDLLLLPGGHAKGIRQYLESNVVQQRALEFMQQSKLVGTICWESITEPILSMSRTKWPESSKSAAIFAGEAAL